MNESYCLYCDEFLKQPQYKMIKSKDICIDFNINDFIVGNNAMYCKNCAGLIKYFNADLLPMQNNKKKQSIYQRKYYILNEINRINKVYNIVMNDYQKYVILGYYNDIHQYEIDNKIPMLNIKFIIKQIYIEILGY